MTAQHFIKHCTKIDDVKVLDLGPLRFSKGVVKVTLTGPFQILSDGNSTFDVMQ